jgi:class 3 adenylate cyclase
VTISVTISGAVAIAAGVAAVLFGVYLYAIRTRWFSRLDRGFFYTFLLAVGGAGIGTALVLGIWFYDVGRHTVFESVATGMRNMGDVVQGEIQEEIERGRVTLLRIAETVSIDMARRRPAEARVLLREVQQIDPRFLQLTVHDEGGALVLVSSTGERHEPPDRIAISHALEGRPFVSEAYVSPVFDRYVLYLAVPLRGAASRQVEGALAARWDLQTDLAGLVTVSRFNHSGHTLVADGNGRVIAHPDAAKVREDISSYPAVREAASGRTGWLIAPNAAGEQRLFAYRPVPSPYTGAGKPWVLLSEERAADALAGIHGLWDDFAIGLGVMIALCLAVATQAAIWLRRPLGSVLDVVRAVQGGDLTQRVAVHGRDELGRLGTALNEMVVGLQERERVKEVFGRYVTTQVTGELLKGEINLGGHRRRVTMLFSDIRNFTTMSEQLSPEDVVGFLNDYFTEMVEAVFEHQGILDKFIGDGIMAVFGGLDDAPEHPHRAVRAALRMKALLAKINGERAILGQPPIAIGIGIHTDEVVVGNIGSRKRLEYTAIGDGVNTCSRVESMNKEFGTTILITESTHAEVADEFQCRAMPEAPLKGKTKIPRLFEVLSARAG